MDKDLKARFTSHSVGEHAQLDMELIRDEALRLAERVDSTVPDSREKSLALTKLEEAVFWANAGISRSGA